MLHIYFLDKDEERLSLFPNLDYKDLYDTLYDFIPDMQYVTNPGIIAKSQSFFHVSLLQGICVGVFPDLY